MAVGRPTTLRTMSGQMLRNSLGMLQKRLEGDEVSTKDLIQLVRSLHYIFEKESTVETAKAIGDGNLQRYSGSAKVLPLQQEVDIPNPWSTCEENGDGSSEASPTDGEVIGEATSVCVQQETQSTL